jgi:ABC-type nickel/cobalt efflux system permease component RcnA
VRRWLARLGVTAGLVVSLSALGAIVSSSAASAHPLGNFTVNRYGGIVLSPGRVRVTYVVDMAEIPTYQTRPAIDTDGDGTISAEEGQAWASKEAAALVGRVRLEVEGRPVGLRVDSAVLTFRPGQAGLPILRLVASFAGALPGPTGALRYEDTNFADRIGWREITLRSTDGVAVAGSTVPTSSVSRELTAYPVDMLSSPLAVTVAQASYRPGLATAGATRSEAGHTVSGAPVASGGSFAALVGRRLTPLVLVVSLALAFGFGAIHALGPGHGKTITAAYLVGSGARVRHAVAAGVAVALMHTASVLSLGLVLFLVARSFPTERVYPWLTLLTGVVALGLGGALLASRLRAHRRGEDPWHTHRHDHDHEHTDHDHHHGAEPVPGRRGLAALAVAGGILPSPTAFVVLTGAVAAHRVGYGLALIGAFSVGLAASLVAVGTVALRLREAVGRRIQGGGWLRLVPLASAAAILGFGVFFAVRGISQLG